MRIARAAAGGAAAAAAAALLYARTLAPTVGAGDSGELIVAAAGMGIPHPPGYGLWLLFARLAAAIPAGSLAFRVNALSACVSALAVGLFWLLARRTGLRPVAAAFATALFATSTIVWRAAVEAEVYGLATAAFLALGLLALRARAASATSRDEALFCFAAGIAPLAHQTLLIPAVLLGGWVLGHRPWRRERALAALGWALAGFSLALVVPARSAAGPSFAFSELRGPGDLLDFYLRRSYGGLAQNSFRPERAFESMGAMAATVAGSIGWAAAGLAAAAPFLAGRRRVPLAVPASAALTIPVSLVLLIAFTPDAEHLAQVAPFLAPVAAAGALLAGGTAESLLRRARGRARAALLAGLAGALLLPLPARYAASDRSGFDLAERYGRDLLAAAPDSAILVLDGDNETFVAAYLTRVAGERPDLEIVHRRGRFFGDPYRLRGVPRAEWGPIQTRIDLERIRTGGRPVCYATPPEDLIAAGVRFRQRGLLYVAERGASARAGAGLAGAEKEWRVPNGWPRSTRLLGRRPERYDYVTRKMAVAYSDAAARRLWDEGRPKEAIPWFADAALVGFDFPEAHLNLATAASAAGMSALAVDALAAACRAAPREAEPAARLAVFLVSAGRARDAARWFERAFRADPGPALAADAAKAWLLAGDRVRAAAWSRRAAALSREVPDRGGRGPSRTERVG